MQALRNIKDRFEAGFRLGIEQRTVGYAYSQNALRLRLDFLEEASFSSVYPFNGKFRLKDVKESVNKLSFITKKCAFLVGETDEKVNYYCLALDKNYFDYLAAIPGNNRLINDFSSYYQEKKTISPQLRQEVLMNSSEYLDMDNWDHQLFYLFFHCWRNEELIALFEAKSVQRVEEK